ncbi:MAG: hypothetical protein D6785_11025 [Planctomycetota bacterium]|nr:MAG: hypothetical protein D6785_11025 [Planctomycetota bacterium]
MTMNRTTSRDIFNLWWPLAGSWLFMALELPMITFFLSRMAHAKFELAAYGSVVFPLCLLLESPIMMILAASTALCKGRDSYFQVWRFMMLLSAALTILHFLAAFTSFYYPLAQQILGVEESIALHARPAFQYMLPWSWAIGYRRFYQGILIRYGKSKAIGWGTLLRIGLNGGILAIGYSFSILGGAGLAGFSTASGVMGEAIFVRIVVHPYLKELKTRQDSPLSFRGLLHFYIPLALTSLSSLMVMPLTTVFLSRLPLPVESLALWPVAMSFFFILRSPAFAYKEVVVAIMERENGYSALKRFTLGMAMISGIVTFAFTLDPIFSFWFTEIIVLTPYLSHFIRLSLVICLLLPFLTVYINWLQGLLVFTKNTRPIIESMILHLLVNILIPSFFLVFPIFPGVYIAALATIIGNLVQFLWLNRAVIRMGFKEG